jgi:hypothetical protein
MGRVAVSTVATRPDFEIVGARVYSAATEGVDVGSLAGMAPAGVRATADPDAALSVDATVLQAVPRVCDAGPGILGPVTPDLHWVPDFRELSDASPVSRVATLL